MELISILFSLAKNLSLALEKVVDHWEDAILDGGKLDKHHLYRRRR
jgi:hypothetical protein